MARESNRLKSEFLATMSHELRTPMNAIEGFTSIMLSGMGGTEFNDATRKYLDRVNANSKRLLGLINDFLDLSRIESGRLKLVSNPLPLEQLALRWRDQVSVLAQNRGLEFSVEIADNLPKTVYGDEENISRIAINLLGNAIKFTEQGSVTMRLYSSGDNWALEVQDTGIGIPPHAREFIFDEFRQVDNSSKRQYGGSGLGLAIVQKLVRAMRGSILLKSEVGEGSTFTVLLPMQ
jgi:signal transduction histidine kinase